jgi:hypothetical protein
MLNFKKKNNKKKYKLKLIMHKKTSNNIENKLLNLKSANKNKRKI